MILTKKALNEFNKSCQISKPGFYAQLKKICDFLQLPFEVL